MKLVRKTVLSALLVFFVCTQAFGFAPFVIKHIRVQGLARISEKTLMNYLPVKVGDKVSDATTAKIIKNLYDTEFFQYVALARDGNTLIINVTERPTIGDINITGNKAITTKNLKDALKNMGIASGQVFDRSALETARKSLADQYYNQGKYNARVEFKVHDESRNRVRIDIVISEGVVAKIASINIIGNKAFPEKTLLKQFKLSTPGFFTFFTHSDQYSKDKLQASLEALKSYYLDRGYIKFNIDSSQVSISPGHDKIHITVKVTEGARYYLKNFKVTGTLLKPASEVRKVIVLEPGKYFSREKVIKSNSALGEFYGDMGYAFPIIQAKPHIDDAHKQISMEFHILPGKRVYVRRISFAGNNKTEDGVLRSAMRQQEGGLVSTKNVKESIRQLNLLGYLKDVKVKMDKVPAKSNQVDLTYHVKEVSSSELTFGVGYSTLEGFLVSAGVTQNNFLGTGKRLSVNFDNSLYARRYMIDYLNPYYTPDGVQRGFGAYYIQTYPDRVNISSYSTNQKGGNMYYIFPLTENNSLRLGFGLRDLSINEGSSAPTEVSSFINAKGRNFKQFLFTPGWSYNGLDSAYFPTTGSLQSFGLTLAAPLGGDNIEYYQGAYNIHWYHPLYKGFIWSLKGNVGYGNGIGSTKALPFFANYTAGGIGSVRGYEGNSLGPQDSNGDALGGNMITTGSVALIVPNGVSDTLRTSLFLDFGNTFQTNNEYGLTRTLDGPLHWRPGDMRYAAGLGLAWRTPIGPLEFSLGFPVHKKAGDKTESFQFTFGLGV